MNDICEKNGVSVVGSICVKNKTTNRAKILEYEEVAKKLPQIDIPVIHHIHGGMYGREITIPKGSVITGQLYKFDHFDIMIEGDITVSTDTGEKKRLQGFNIFKGMSGKKRAGYAHEDTRWVTFHPFDGDSGEEIQSFITAKTFEELDAFNNEVNQLDYYDFVKQTGMTQAQILEQVLNSDDLDLSDMPGVYIANSQIEGEGLFSSKQFHIGDVICLARDEDKRKLGGRYTNHALFPNAEMRILVDCVELVAARDIEENEEITVNYRDVIKQRFSKGDLCQE